MAAAPRTAKNGYFARSRPVVRLRHSILGVMSTSNRRAILSSSKTSWWMVRATAEAACQSLRRIKASIIWLLTNNIFTRESTTRRQLGTFFSKNAVVPSGEWVAKASRTRAARTSTASKANTTGFRTMAAAWAHGSWPDAAAAARVAAATHRWSVDTPEAARNRRAVWGMAHPVWRMAVRTGVVKAVWGGATDLEGSNAAESDFEEVETATTMSEKAATGLDPPI
mmetsp:Transcript_10172/g.18828  ORF Transcript_10172/g.18828 Transcript_10172/m.18828 type:complete len:225 (-) Transcript_10172:1099-1773(-)